MSRENPLWGAPRIQSEICLLGYTVAESTVVRYMDRSSKPPSQTWRTFTRNHADQIVAIDFFTVPTITSRVLYGFLILRHDRRRVVPFNVTVSPTAEWTAQQIVEAFPYEEAPRFILRDRDGIYGEVFCRRVKHMGIEEVMTAYRSPWQNPYVERLIGPIRRECLDHVIVLSEAHLHRILAQSDPRGPGNGKRVLCDQSTSKNEDWFEFRPHGTDRWRTPSCCRSAGLSAAEPARPASSRRSKVGMTVKTPILGPP